MAQLPIQSKVEKQTIMDVGLSSSDKLKRQRIDLEDSGYESHSSLNLRRV